MRISDLSSDVCSSDLIWALHIPGSNNPLGIDVKGKQDTFPFYPYYISKDAFGLGVFMLFFAYFMFFAPNSLGHPDNYIPANPTIGRVSCRERVCQYGSISVVAVSLKKTTKHKS